MGGKGLGRPMVFCEVFWSRTAMYGLRQYGIGVVVVQDEEVLCATSGCGGEAFWEIRGDQSLHWVTVVLDVAGVSVVWVSDMWLQFFGRFYRQLRRRFRWMCRVEVFPDLVQLSAHSGDGMWQVLAY